MLGDLHERFPGSGAPLAKEGFSACVGHAQILHRRITGADISGCTCRLDGDVRQMHISPMQLATFLSEHAITDADFAAKIGVDRSSVHRMRNGKQRPSADAMRSIVEHTNGAVTANDFFGIAAPTPEAVRAA